MAARLKRILGLGLIAGTIYLLWRRSRSRRPEAAPARGAPAPSPAQPEAQRGVQPAAEPVAADQAAGGSAVGPRTGWSPRTGRAPSAIR